MYCNNCGVSNPDQATACQSCGAPLTSAQENSMPPQPPTYDQQQYQQQPTYDQQQQPYGQQQYGQQQPYGQTYDQQMEYKPRTAPLILGIIGIIFAILLPIVTYACSIPGLVMANTDIKRGSTKKASRILNIVALVLAIINSIAGVYIALSGM